MQFNYRPKFKDFFLLFFTRAMRMFSYGMLAVVFLKHLVHKGFQDVQISSIQSGVVFGDVFISLVLTTQADKIGRIRTLMFGSLLKLITGLIYAQTQSFYLILISGILGVISVSGGQIGPFMPIQQSALTQLTQECCLHRDHIKKYTTAVFGYYNMVGYVFQAFGSMFAGQYISFFSQEGVSPEVYTQLEKNSMIDIVRIYAFLGGVKFVGYYLMNKQRIEPVQSGYKKLINCTGIQNKNIKTILNLSGLFAVDAFAGAFVAQSFISYYYRQRYSLDFDSIGLALFVCNIISGISGVLSSVLVDKIGAMATMIYTHLPSNIFLLLIAYTDNKVISIIFLFARFCISQMDVPARQVYVSMVVSAQQRSAANGITNIARSVGLTFGLFINGYYITMHPSSDQFSHPFIIAGGLKIIYDITIGLCFLWSKKAQQNEERNQQQLQSTEIVQTPSNVQEEQR